MKPRIVLVLKYLVTQALAGNMHVVDGLYDYFVNRMSPSEIGTKYGFTRHQVRGWVQRIMEKVASYERARVMIKHLVPHVKKIKPIVKKVSDDEVQCTLCGERMHRSLARDHVERYHRELVTEYVFAIIDTLSKSLSSNRSEEVEPA